MAGQSVPSASARLVATVDLPTPPFPLATATMLATPGMGCGPRGRGGGAAVDTTSMGPVTPGIAATATRTASSICRSISGCAVVGAR